jgi:hypothetical protein
MITFTYTYKLIMNNKSFLTTNPEIFKRATETLANRSIQLQEIDLGDIAATLLED